ncbi:MAG: phosphoribosyltransferase family protein [Patescibacteria group bacterium]
MNEKTSEKIIKYIENKGQATCNELAHHLTITTRAIRKQLGNLLEKGKLYKIGKPPRVFYFILKDKKQTDTIHVDSRIRKLIDKNFFLITPAGQREDGFRGFVYWCNKQKLPIEKTALEYEKTFKKYLSYKKNSFIDGMYKIKHTFNKVFVDKVFYIDFYSIERFGKTKLGQLLLYAKQSQNKTLIKELVDQIKPQISALMEKFKIDAVGFIPPTVKREIQIMKELERQLNLPVPTINLVKVKTPVSVPQKTLNKLEDRVENAKSTIIVDDIKKYKTILLVDDALGSGATLNETAQKIKNQGVAKKIIGLAITGSFSGFEVISEV